MKTLITFLVLLLSYPLPAIVLNSPDKTNEIVVYSSRQAHLIQPLFREFTKQTGIKVSYLTAAAGALIERIKLEGDKTKADILMTVDAGNLWYAKQAQLFQAINSDFIDSAIPKYLKDEDNHWFGLSMRARTIVYHTKRVQEGQLSSYKDLAHKKWHSRLCLRSSNKIYNKSLVASMIFHIGETKTSQVISGWVDNLASKPYAKDLQVMQAILAGKCDVGLVNTYYYGRLIKKNPNAPLKLFWANQDSSGVHINISGAAILKHAKSPALATKLLVWLSSAKAQALYSSLNQEYPANQNIAPHKIVSSWGSFKHDTMPLSHVGKNQAKAVKLMQAAGYR